MHYPIAFAVALAALIVQPVDAAQPARDHPVVGTWTFTLPDGKCSETYLFRADGTMLITSGDEVAESRYEISSKPSAKKFFKLDNTIVKVNGKKDCSGQTMEVGQKATNYIHLESPNDRMAICQTESLDACFGPLRRAGGQRT